jgi:hypothetical protein
MAFIGNSPTTQSFTGGMDSFNGNASNTVFGLSRTLNTAYDVDVYVENVWQRPGVGYSVSSNTITFSSAPSAGSNNVVVVYRNFTATTLQPADGSVSTRNLGTITNINAGTNAGLSLQANNATVITANATGAVAFATNTATFGTTLTLASNGNITHTPAAGGRMQIGDFSNTSNYHELWLQGSDDLVSAGIQVVRRSVVSGGSYAGNNLLRMTAGGLVYGTDDLKFTSYDTVSGYNTRMTVSSNGNVGIGTSTPGAGIRLDVQGGEIRAGRIDSSSEGGQISLARSSDNATGWYMDVYGNTSTPSLRLVDVSSGAVSLVINSSGAVALRGGGSASGVGITFPSSQSASSDANTLDDYEEGTWTPSYSVSGASGFTYLDANGWYVKIGRQVTCFFRLNVNSLTSASGSSQVFVAGLPFTASSGNGIQGTFNLIDATRWGANFPITGYVVGGTTTIGMLRGFGSTTLGSDPVVLAASDMRTGSSFNGNTLQGSLTYLTST